MLYALHSHRNKFVDIKFHQLACHSSEKIKMGCWWSRTPEDELEDAIQQNDVEAVRKMGNGIMDIILHDSIIGTCRGAACTAVHYAARVGSSEVLKELIAAGADVSKANNAGYTPLDIAAENGHVEVINALCKYGADVNQAGTSDRYAGCTPLYIAAGLGHVEVINALCAHGADVNKADGIGFTPMHIAAQYGQAEVINALCSHGAATTVALNGESPLTALLEFTNTIQYTTVILYNNCTRHAQLADDASSLNELLCDNLMLLLSAGCHAGERDHQLMNSDILRPVLAPRGIQEYATFCDMPASLQRLCKLAVRCSTHKPLTTHLPELDLPPHLHKYLLLEILESKIYHD